jgi:hypothetical protein
MIVFVDFEASSLSKKSVPVEVAWVFEDGRAQSHLIRPPSDWTDWSAEAEAIHGLSRSRLQKEGAPVETVVAQMLDQLTGHELCASAPSWDGKWLSALLRAAGKPRHALRLKKSDDLFKQTAQRESSGLLGEEEIAGLVDDIIRRTEPEKPAHRALPDAQLERERMMCVIAEVRTRVKRVREP